MNSEAEPADSAEKVEPKDGWSGPTKFLAGVTALVGALATLVGALAAGGVIGGDSADPPTTPPTATAVRADEPAPTLTPLPAPELASISIRYADPVTACSLPISLIIGNQTVVPTSNLHRVDNLEVGPQNYQVGGTIDCGFDGSCNAQGTGVIDVRAGQTYDIIWTPLGGPTCSVELQ